MEQEKTSFWNGIKKFEDILAENPASYCFAQLSELYRRTGLLDDAVGTAEKGCEQHPEYVAGWQALAFALLDKGAVGKGTDLLARVVRATPENIPARNRLVTLYMEVGELRPAEDLLKVILSLDPDDAEARDLLETLSRRMDLEKGADEAPLSPVPDEISLPGYEEEDLGICFQDEGLDEEPVEEELFLLDDEDLIEEIVTDDTAGDEFQVAPAEPPGFPPPPVAQAEAKDPLTTGTLAELYVAQGFTEKALNIYRELHQNNPANAAIMARIKELESAVAPDLSMEESSGNVIAAEATVVSVATGGTDAGEGAVETLQRWLDNIARRR